MDEQPIQIAPKNRQFASKSIWDRVLAIFAGPFMNFALAFVLFILYAMLNGIPTNEPQLGKLIPNEPAVQSGLQQGDRVLAINGNPISTWEELVTVIQKNPGNRLTFKIKRDGKTFQVPVTPAKEKLKNGKVIGKIG
ncbi:MAG TPA: M50 family metallopeptidase, partial [Bacillales bacterium]|nr:M50 family metallopeptidase [Bacillales bacterium]